MTASLPESTVAEAARHVEVRWQSERALRNLSRVHARRAGQQRRGLLGASVVALAAAAAVTLFLMATLREPARRPVQVPVASVAGASPKTTFADGSVALVSTGSELVVKSASVERVESVLVSGAADFVVTKNPARQFVVVAGNVRVRVVGTRFRVERSAERTRVSVSEGKVEVQEGDVRHLLEAGESRFFPSVPVAAREEAPSVAPNARARFLELARGGELKAAYQVMSQSPSAVGSGPEDLMLAADAARISSHPEQAVGYLRRVTSEHPADSRAPLAAFTLGRLLLSQLSRPGEAAEAFALTRRLRPSGSLAEDALAREAEARAASGSTERARTLASAYVAQHPRGKHVSTMQRLASGK